MITITRLLARTVRAVFRRAGIKSRGGSGPRVFFSAGAEGLHIRAMSAETAIEYHQPGSFPVEELSVPLEALDNCEGAKPEPVTLEKQGQEQVTVGWSGQAIPQLLVYHADSESNALAFPERPATFARNSPELWQALREAAATADHEAVRYALDHIQLRGQTGQIVATDGRQLLKWSGLEFPWTDDLLVRASGIFASKELNSDQPVLIGKTDDWVALVAEPWTIWLRINKDARFPKVDDLLRPMDLAPSQLQLAPSDRDFLLKALPSLPSEDQLHDPITLELNGRVAVRAKAAEVSRPTELVLTNSRYTGETLTLNINRRFVERALKLGFSQIAFYGANSPPQCADDRRSSHRTMPCASSRRRWKPLLNHHSLRQGDYPWSDPLTTKRRLSVRLRSRWCSRQPIRMNRLPTPTRLRKLKLCVAR